CLNGDILLWKLTDGDPASIIGKKPLTLHGHQYSVRGLAFREEKGSLQLISASDDGTARLWWDIENKRPSSVEIAREQASIRGLAMSPDGNLLAFAGADKSMRLWSFTVD